MQPGTRSELLARLALSVGAMLPYLPLLGFNSLYITDDRFTSDIYNGELPGRVLVGKLLAAGQAPVWTSHLCGGFPLGAGAVGEPVSLLAFSTLPIAPALCALVVVLMMVAAHGAYDFTRRLGANRTGAVLAGIAYAGSGYMATQLKHLAILATVVWLPYGLLLLERALANSVPSLVEQPDQPRPNPSLGQRWLALGLFGLLFAEQVLSGFPQSVYISGLVYATWATVLLLRLKGSAGRWPLRLLLGGGLGLAAALGALGGSVVLVPLAELASTSDRHVNLGWEFASMLPYSPSDALSFLFPYINGDVSDMSYVNEGLFWENYGYVGLATALLAVFALLRGTRRPRVLLISAIVGVSFVLVLGKNTPVFFYAWKYLPGMSNFRFPTRFLFVVDLGLAALGGLGLTLLGKDLERLLQKVAPHAPRLIVTALCLGTALDLFAHQPRQNPFVSGPEWLSPPGSLALMKGRREELRTYAPWHDYFHRVAHAVARGWMDLRPYWDLRDTLAPNLGVYWDVPSADCYVGMMPRWVADVWGGHMRPGYLVSYLTQYDNNNLTASESLGRVLATYGVTHVLTPLPLVHPDLKPLGNTASTAVYGVDGKRLRVVPYARRIADSQAAARVLVSPRFNPSQLVLLSDAPSNLPQLVSENNHWPEPGEVGEARVVAEGSDFVRIQAKAPPDGGYLVLNDTYYPGWRATVDKKPANILRANIAVRALWLTAGSHVVEFHYDAPAFYRGLRYSLGGVGLLAAWVVSAAYAMRRSRARRSPTSTRPPSSE